MAFTRRTQKPESSLKNVTRSTRPEICWEFEALAAGKAFTALILPCKRFRSEKIPGATLMMKPPLRNASAPIDEGCVLLAIRGVTTMPPDKLAPRGWRNALMPGCRAQRNVPMRSRRVRET